MTLTPGTRLGPYEIIAALGAGGMGEVYQARDTRLERDVAVKVLSAALTDSPLARERFQREARAVAALQHPNICTIYDVGTASDQQAFLVMELLQGETLEQRLARGPLDLVLLVDVALALADALDVAHGAGIAHRDIKPANILLTPRGPKILDFGLAKAISRPTATSTEMTIAPDSLLTDAGKTVGTVAYMSPEQLRGEDLDARTDLFSFGLVLYEMATGRRAFAGATNAVISAAILHQEPPPPREIRPDLPPPLEAVIVKAIEKDRNLRYQHASDIRTDIQRLKRDSDSNRSADNVSRGSKAATRKRWKTIVPAVAAALIAAVLVSYFYVQPRHRLTDKDTIVVADFTNTTGDSVFDGTLRQGLAIQLEQSPFLSLVSEQTIQKTLALMGQPADVRLTPTLAREVCERTASTAVLEGSVASLGSQYVLGLRAKNCTTGDVLDEEQVQTPKKEDVLNALSQMASKFRARIGESLATVEKHNTPLIEATTPSLEALKVYSTAWKFLRTAPDEAPAVPLLKRAVEIDPKFAMAYAVLGRAYADLGESVLSAESTSKAYELRDRTSDAERFFITAAYDTQVTGNLERARETCELWAQTYPRDVRALTFLSAFIYQQFGNYEKSIEVTRKAIEIDPDFFPGYVNLAGTYGYVGRLADAEATLQAATDRNLQNPFILITRYQIEFLKGDQAAMERAAVLGRGKPGVGDWLADQEALVMAYSGHLQQARAMSRQAVDSAQQANQREMAALFEDVAALREAFFGNIAESRRSAMAALALSKGRDVQFGAAFALALAGDSLQSQTLADDLEKRFPEDTEVRFAYSPAIRAQLALNHGEPSRAIELLQTAARYELGAPVSAIGGYFGALYPVYVRGEAYLALHRGAEAVVEFQKILDHRGIVINDPVGALAHLQVGRAYAVLGDTTRAKTNYGDFLTLWKDADRDIPVLTQAQTEYAKLP